MYFKESTHEYTNKEDLKYTSVTTFLKEFSKQKNWNNIAQGYLNKHLSRGTLLSDLSKKWGITLDQATEKWGDADYTVDWILSVWSDNSSRSSEGGSTYHLNRELEQSVESHTVYNPVVNDVKAFMDLENLTPDTTYLELGVGSHLHKIWGQADRIIIGKGSCEVRDYKTNKKREDLEPEGIPYFNKDLGRKVINYLLPPVSHIIDNKYWNYALQLSMYGYFLELYGYKPTRLVIDYVHTKYITYFKLDRTKHEILSEEPDLNRVRIVDTSKGNKGIEEIEVPYLRREIIDILKYRQAKLIDNEQ